MNCVVGGAIAAPVLTELCSPRAHPPIHPTYPTNELRKSPRNMQCETFKGHIEVVKAAQELLVSAELIHLAPLSNLVLPDFAKIYVSLTYGV